jgi:hypothetical protein
MEMEACLPPDILVILGGVEFGQRLTGRNDPWQAAALP